MEFSPCTLLNTGNKRVLCTLNADHVVTCMTRQGFCLSWSRKHGYRCAPRPAWSNCSRVVLFKTLQSLLVKQFSWQSTHAPACCHCQSRWGFSFGGQIFTDTGQHLSLTAASTTLQWLMLNCSRRWLQVPDEWEHQNVSRGMSDVLIGSQWKENCYYCCSKQVSRLSGWTIAMGIAQSSFHTDGELVLRRSPGQGWRQAFLFKIAWNFYDIDVPEEVTGTIIRSVPHGQRGPAFFLKMQGNTWVSL